MPKRKPVRTITPSKPRHEDRFYDAYPIRCEVEPLAPYGADAENTEPWDGPDGYGDPFQ